MVNIIIFNDKLIKIYSKKIMGFSYNKTHSLQLAEDLSQDILLCVFDALKSQKHIENMDGFVYTICCYTWSKFLRKNKKNWNNTSIDDAYDLYASDNVEQDVLTAIMIEKMKTEIAYLSKLHRQITLMTYFENKSGEEISLLLNIPHSTVRWHLGEIRKKIKEGIEMEHENLNYIPKKLSAGHDGYLGEYGPCGLGQDRLVDNICIACYGKALTLEEIARRLSVASAYIENHIERLVYMDYLKVVGKNKYQTNFFIRNYRHILLVAKYQFENISPIAKKIYIGFDSRYERIKSIGFLGCSLDKDFVLWGIISLVTNDLYFKSLKTVFQKNNLANARPKHKDGSEHWVCADQFEDDATLIEAEFSKEIMNFNKNSVGSGIKTRNRDGLSSLQLDSFATINRGINWRNFDGTELIELTRIAEIIRNNQTPNEMDKVIIAKHVKEGYVKVENERPVMLIPYFTTTEFHKLKEIMTEIKLEIGEDIFVTYIENFAKMFLKEIPPFVPETDRIHFGYNIYPQYAVLYSLSDSNILRYPTDEECKRLCTVVWNTK